MNKITIGFASLLYIAFLILFNTSSFEEKEEHENKNAPNDFFFFQRSFPSANFPLEAYRNALKEAQSMAFERDGNNISQNIGWKSEGPGNIGGRVNAIAVSPTDDNIVLVGYSAGGIFRTADGGRNWSPVFDQFAYTSISSIAFDPTNSKRVYAGTGDQNISGTPFIGDGLYISDDAGETWRRSSFDKIGIISKVMVHPQNSNLIYVSSMGNPFVRNSERGLYKSTDKGQTWSKILYLSDQAGIIDFEISHDNPNVIIASGWDRIRTDYESVVYGANTKLVRTTDGGLNWEDVNLFGTPKQTSRINLEYEPKSNKFYASVINTNFELEGIYFSINDGYKWTALETSLLPKDLMGGFGWYFGNVVVNPYNTNQIFILGVETYQTFNEGQEWQLSTEPASGQPVHVDNHAMAFDSKGNYYLGTDGGAYFYALSNAHWVKIENNPVTQFYKVAYNLHKPNNYYGGAQDNGTISGNSSTFNSWNRIFSGDGFTTIFHPTDPKKYYIETQYGNIFFTGNGDSETPLFTAKLDLGLDTSQKRNWSMPYIMSRHNSEKLLCGTYKVYKLYHKSSNTIFANSSWIPISGDLTNATNKEDRFHNITCVEESPLDSNLIYAGTSDANFWRTSIGGGNFGWAKSVGLPQRYITSIKASPTIRDAVYVSFSGYRANDNTPHIYKSNDRGSTFTSIHSNLPNLAINDILILPNTKDSILFVATDGGVYFSNNAGSNWNRLGNNMPYIPVFDLELNAIRNELVAGTYARSIFTFPIDSLSLNNTKTFNINGLITDDVGKNIKDVVLNLLPGVNATTTIASVDGTYNIWSIPSGSNLSIAPDKYTEYKFGVSTADMVSIRKHILALEFLKTPYKWIAADVNNDQKVSTADMVAIRKVVLGIDTAFPNVPCWKFVPADYVFADTENYLNNVIPLKSDISNIANTQNIDFIGVKMGDVNNSATALLGEGEERGNVFFNISNTDFKTKETIKVPVFGDELNEKIEGFQGTLNFKNLAFKSIESGSLTIEDYHLNLRNAQKGKIAISFDEAVSPSHNQPLFYLIFEAISDGQLSQSLSWGSSITRSEAYDSHLHRLSLSWKFRNESSDISIFPNPTRTGQAAFISFPSVGEKQIEIFDLKGSKVFEGKSTGELTHPLPFLKSGVYLIKTQFGSTTTVKKFLVE